MVEVLKSVLGSNLYSFDRKSFAVCVIEAGTETHGLE